MGEGLPAWEATKTFLEVNFLISGPGPEVAEETLSGRNKARLAGSDRDPSNFPRPSVKTGSKCRFEGFRGGA